MFRLIALCIITLSSPVAFAENITVLVLGDSISAGYGLPTNQVWVEKLNSRLQQTEKEYTVVNASISGDTTSGGIARLPAAIKRHNPQIVIIELGGNDGLRGLSLKQMRINLEQMIQLTQDNQAKALILGMRIPSNYGPAYTKRFGQVFSKVAEKTGAAIMPFFLAPIAEDISNFQPDGIHPSVAAQEKLLDGMWPYLEPLL